MRRSIDENIRSGLYATFSGYVRDDIEKGLGGLSGGCKRREDCIDLFNKKIEDMLRKSRDVDPDSLIKLKYGDFQDLFTSKPQDKCKACYDVVLNIVEKQANIIRAISQSQVAGPDIFVSDLDVEEVVASILDPISNPLRLKIMQVLYNDSRSFSYLSEVTGLEGGNLLFHIKKLKDAHLVVQKQERGDYNITELGRGLVDAIAETYHRLHLNED